jgi:tetratricopeptide (TPR) repeat protein
MDASYLLIGLANRLESFAAKAKNNNSAAFAYIKHAEALRADIHYRPVLVRSSDLNDRINRAKISYNRAFNLAGTVSLIASARYGLGLCAEELGNFDEAKKIYSEILANTDFESTIAFVQAGQRLETMDAYKQKIVFMEPPKSITQPAIAPNMPRTIDANIGSTLQPGQVGINRTSPKPAPTPAASEVINLTSPSDTNAAGDSSAGS